MRRCLSAFAAITALATPASAQGFGQPSGFNVENPVLRRLWALGMDSSRASGLAQVLFDSLGRGSPRRPAWKPCRTGS